MVSKDISVSYVSKSYGGQAMTTNENVRLCGGIYFTLLLQARKPRKGVREHFRGESDGLSDPEMLVALLKVVIPDYNEPTATTKATFKGNTSDYKSCKISKSVYLPFDDSAVVSAFDSRVTTEYPRALSMMSDFVAGFIDSGTSTRKDERLVKALLEIIEADHSIDDTQVFYIGDSGQGITKATLRSMNNFCLQSFLLGVWHFIIANRNDNKAGKATFDLLCPPRDGAERKYEGKLGDAITRVINVTQINDVGNVARGTLEAAGEAVNNVVSEDSGNSNPQPIDTDPKRITVNNYGTVKNQKFISIETMNGDIKL
jgi:hypothetical protein